MSIFKLIDVKEKKYLFDAYNNTMDIISDELYELIENQVKNRRYYKLIKEFNLRDIFEDKELEIISPLDDQKNKQKIECKQKQLVLSITENCNMRCEYCGYHDKYQHNYNPHTMSKETIERSIKQFMNHSTKSEEVFISFYGGEPLIGYDKIKYAVQVCEQNHLGQMVNYSITTNGTLLTEEIIDFLVEHNFILVISLDGPNKIHDRYRKNFQGDPTYDNVIRNIKKIKTKYPEYYEEKLMFNAVVAPPYNIPMLNDYFGCSKVNMMELNFTDYFKEYINGLPDQEDNLDDDNARPNYDLMNDIKELKKFHLINRDDEHKIADPCGYCLPYCKRIFVNCDGKLIVCEKVDERCEDYCIGDVENWIQYERMENLFKKTNQKVSKNCSKCWAIRFCNTCFLNEKELDYESEYCNSVRQKIEEEYKKYIELLDEDITLVSLINKFSIE